MQIMVQTRVRVSLDDKLDRSVKATVRRPEKHHPRSAVASPFGKTHGLAGLLDALLVSEECYERHYSSLTDRPV
jgi:hypothetical protein